MVWIKTKIKGSRTGNLEIRTTPFNEIGIIELPEKQVGMSVYWDIEDLDKVIEILKEAKERHLKEVIE